MSQPEPIPPDTVLPCGCIIRTSVVDGVNTLTVIPCRQSCVNYLNMLGLAAEKGITPTFKKIS